MELLDQTHHDVLQGIENAAILAGRPGAVRLLAVAKTQPAGAVRALAAKGQVAFAENYVREAAQKRGELADLALEWHFIGHLQSNKAALAATLFDWVQSVDREKLVQALAAARPATLPPLNVLIQVNIDGQSGKSGCDPGSVPRLADAVAAAPTLRLRGLMAIPEPHPDPARRRDGFRAMHALFADLARKHPGIDTLSMGMSADYGMAIAEGATMVRIGTALFGARPPTPRPD